MSAPVVAWMDGCWGTPEQLQLPLNDRGLLLGDGLFETVLIKGEQPQLLEAHLRRWHQAASLLGMACPPEQTWLQPLIAQAVQRAALPNGWGALRLNWSRGGGNARGIDLPEPPLQPRFWLQLSPHTPRFDAVSAIVSRHEQRNSASLLSRCKTLSYGQAIQARREAQAAGAEEALLLSTRGDLCCGSTANLLVHRQGLWLTPPLSSGCLPGVMRARLLERGEAREAELAPQPEPGDQWLLINSLSCRPISRIDGHPLQPLHTAQTLWSSLF